MIKENLALLEKVRKYGDKQTIIEYVSKDPQQPLNECLSTQDESSFFDSNHLISVPKTYDGLKLLNSTKID